MSNTTITLQRIRFSAISPTEYKNESFFKTGFSLAAWEKRGQSCYWSTEGTSAEVRHTVDGVALSRDEKLDSDSYFNALFLGHWLKLTSVRNFGLRIRLSGRARISIQAHTHLAEAKTILSAEVDHAAEASWEAAIAQSDMPASAIRLSFTVTALSQAAAVKGGEWYTTDAPSQAVSVAIIIPTYNRANFARKAISSLLADTVVESVISRLLVVEQSDRAELNDLAGGKCVHIRQGNLGGAGGFARGMYECITDGTLGNPTHLLLMDDDIMIETDSILRVIRMAEFRAGNYVLGGGMLDLFKPNLAVALGESSEVNEYGFLGIEKDYANADMARPNTLNMASLPQAEGYCAWWFCFFPIQVIHQIGFPLPCFFRGDDMNFGIRAKKAGFEPYMIPGIGLWHLPFASKSIPWVNYFARYNELVENALCGGSEVDRFFAYSVYEIKSLLARKAVGYAASAVRALEDYLRGWEHYRDRSFPAHLIEIRNFLADYSASDNTPEAAVRLKIRGAQIEARATAALARYQTQALRIQKEFVQNIPRVYSSAAWAPYFGSGSMKHLGPKGPKEPGKAPGAYEASCAEARSETVLH